VTGQPRRAAWWWAMQAFWAALAIWAATYVLILFTALGAIEPLLVINQWAFVAVPVFALLSWLLHRVAAARRR